MPNWNYNSVEIHAPLEAVKAWLAPAKGNTYQFNMHKLFPEKVPASDPTGEATWDYDWYVENTGSKWAPEVLVNSAPDPSITYLAYDSARAPNNGTLQKLHELTGWEITNDYEEPGMQFAGSFVCRDGACEDIALEYQTSCEICEEKKGEDEFDEELDGLICNECRRKTTNIS